MIFLFGQFFHSLGIQRDHLAHIHDILSLLGDFRNHLIGHEQQCIPVRIAHLVILSLDDRRLFEHPFGVVHFRYQFDKPVPEEKGGLRVRLDDRKPHLKVPLYGT